LFLAPRITAVRAIPLPRRLRIGLYHFRITGSRRNTWKTTWASNHLAIDICQWDLIHTMLDR
jgi:hypothetical protein